jgi:hypothetical protein
MTDIFKVVAVSSDDLFETRRPGLYVEVLTIEDQLRVQKAREVFEAEIDEEELEF